MPYTKAIAYGARTAYRYRKNRSYYNKTAKDTAHQALRTATALKRLLNVEFHVHDVAATTAVSSTAQIIDLTEIAEGTNQTQRVGKSILLKSFLQRGSARIDTSATASALRIMLIHDLDNTGSAPSATDILTSESFVANLNLAANLNRFRILMDRTMSFSNNGTQRISWKKYIRLNHHVKFSGSAAASNQKGSLFLLLISNESTNSVNINIQNRLRFIDN